MAGDYDYPSYDAGGRVKKKKAKSDPMKRPGYYDIKKTSNKDLKYSGQNPEGYQKYLDKQDFGTAFNLTKNRYDQFKWRGKVYTTEQKDKAKKKK